MESVPGGAAGGTPGCVPGLGDTAVTSHALMQNSLLIFRRHKLCGAFFLPLCFPPGDLAVPDRALGLYTVIPWGERFPGEWGAAGGVCQHPEVALTMCGSAEHHQHQFTEEKKPKCKSTPLVFP